MIIGGSKSGVIDNIRLASERGELNAKVETSDPDLTQEQSDSIVYGYAQNRKKLLFKAKSFIARVLAAIITKQINNDTEIEGLEKLKPIKGGAVITCNHFNPLDNTTMRYMTKKANKKRLYTVAQETNLAMTGIIGFFMNYADIIPISRNLHYMRKEFSDIIGELISKGEWVLIYPEQEMWFNYRKPRTLKPGAYHYASKHNVPIISCFVEMTDLKEDDNDEFFKVKYKIHILDPIFPDETKSPRENSRIMQQKDGLQKQEAYENAYGMRLDYSFAYTDIAGYKNQTQKRTDRIEKNTLLPHL